MPLLEPWEEERRRLLGRRISELGLSLRGSRIERLVNCLYEELAAKGVRFRPPVYLSDQWGCPDGTPLIGVPFYLVDDRLGRIEAEMSGELESDGDAMRYLRHECGHAINYAFRIHARPEWRPLFGSMAKVYRERYRADPFSRNHVRHILGWYAQKHPDEDFAETFAVWLTPGLDWRREYAEWPALAKLEYVDGVMREIGDRSPPLPTAPTEEDLPVDTMHYTVAEFYESATDEVPAVDRRQFDVDLRRIFRAAGAEPNAEPARRLIERYEPELVSRISYWSGEPPPVVRAITRALAQRSGELDLRVGGAEALALIELAAFGSAVVLNHRYSGLARSGRASVGDGA